MSTAWQLQQTVTPCPADEYLERWRGITSPSTLPVFEEQVHKDALFCDSRPPAGAPALPAQAIRPGVPATHHNTWVYLLPSPHCAFMPRLQYAQP